MQNEMEHENKSMSSRLQKCVQYLDREINYLRLTIIPRLMDEYNIE